MIMDDHDRVTDQPSLGHGLVQLNSRTLVFSEQPKS